MDVEVFPWITPDDYAAFRRLIGADMPGTFIEWLERQRKEIRENIQAGKNAKTIEVNSAEFVRFLHSRKAHANIASFRNFTIEKEAGNTY
jgi:hypothetical protein